MIISLGFELPRTSSSLPEDLDRAGRFAGHTRRPTSVFLFGLAPGDAYRAGDVTIPAVGSYPAVSPLPIASDGRFIFCDTFREPGLSPVPPARSTRHAAFRCPDFPLPIGLAAHGERPSAIKGNLPLRPVGFKLRFAGRRRQSTSQQRTMGRCTARWFPVIPT